MNWKNFSGFSLFVSILLTSMGCGAGNSSIRSDIMRLQNQHKREVERLDQVQRQITEAEKAAAIAAEEAEYLECRARVAKAEAQASARQADCWHQKAAAAKCRATNAERRASGTFWGCLAGIGVSAVTGGAAVPLALVGCGAGNLTGELRGQQCTEPSCAGQVYSLKNARVDVGDEEQLQMCGGYFGLDVETQRTATKGVKVMSVGGDRTTAKAVGIRPGDIVLEVDGTQTTDLASMQVALQRHRTKARILILLVRSDIPLLFEGPRSRVQFNGRESPNPQLGITLEPNQATTYQSGARIVAIRSDHVRSLDELRVDDVIVQAGEEAVWSEESLRDALRLIRPEERVSLTVVRRGERLVVETAPERRGGREGI